MTRSAAAALSPSAYEDGFARADRIVHVLRSDLGLATGNRVLLRGATARRWQPASWLSRTAESGRA